MMSFNSPRAFGSSLFVPPRAFFLVIHHMIGALISLRMPVLGLPDSSFWAILHLDVQLVSGWWLERTTYLLFSDVCIALRAFIC
jgi:hypothetical protein